MDAPSPHPLHKPVQHPLLPGLVEIDGELVAFHGHHVAVAELHVEDAVACREVGGGVGDGFGDEFALYGAALDRFAAGAVAGVCLAIADAFDADAGARTPVLRGAGVAVLPGALPAGRGAVGGEGIGLVEARGAIGAVAAIVG